MKKHQNPYKLFINQAAARFSYFLTKDQGQKLILAESYGEECKDIKSRIEDYGKEDSPEDPPYPTE